jgi:ADP-heptose:LPS heptosyltransferase
MNLTSIIKKSNIFYKLFLISSNSLLKSFRLLIPKNKEGKIIVVSLHKIGDSVFTIPAIRFILKEYKKISIICYPESVPVYKSVFDENVEYITLTKSHFLFSDRIAGSSARKILNSNSPAVIYDLTTVMTSASLIFNSSAKEIIGINREFFKGIFTSYSPMPVGTHLSEIYLKAAGSKLNVQINSDIYGHKINPDRGEVIYLNPFAGWESKEWNHPKFVELAILLSEKHSVKFVADKPLSDELMSELKKYNIPYIITSDLQSLIDILKEECYLMIGNDSGPLYIANLLGAPTFTIYGPTNPSYSMPVGKFHRFIRKEIKCTPITTQYCHTNAGRPCPYYECMDTLSVSEVYQQVNLLIQDLELDKKKYHI